MAIIRGNTSRQTKLLQVRSVAWGFFTDMEVRRGICHEAAPNDYQWQRDRIYRDQS